uniref:Uncharacterized protein n=1 Tax=Equus asinus asinus TaxID=83772 RepID=A0A8C4M520_EQUAS
MFVSPRRWSSRRASLANGHSYLPSSTCYHSASPQHPCSATTGLWAYRRCPSPCAGKVWQPGALTCHCPWMEATPTHHPRRWCNTAGRLGMTASPSVPSAVACGYPVRKSWKNQVAASLLIYFSPRDLMQAKNQRGVQPSCTAHGASPEAQYLPPLHRVLSHRIPPASALRSFP